MILLLLAQRFAVISIAGFAPSVFSRLGFECEARRNCNKRLRDGKQSNNIVDSEQ
jgi:hypothetical protein